MRLLPDLIKEFNVHVERGVYQRKRGYCVADIPQDNPAIVPDLALTCPRLPRLFVDGLPFRPSAVATKYDVEPFLDAKLGKPAKDRVWVVVTYEDVNPLEGGSALNPLVVQYGSATRVVRTDTDREGKMLSVYNGLEHPKKMRAECDVEVEDPFIRVSRWVLVKDESVRGLEYPNAYDRFYEKYNGKVNKSTFRGKPPHYWKARVEAVTMDKGSSYEIVATVLGREAFEVGGASGWDEWLAWRYPHNQMIPTYADKSRPGYGFKRADKQYFEADFTRLFDDMLAL